MKDCREIEKDAPRVSKRTLDIFIMKDVGPIEIEICPKYLRFCLPKLKAFRDKMLMHEKKT